MAVTQAERGARFVERCPRRASPGANNAPAPAALGAFVRAAEEMKGHGTFDFAAEALPYAEIREWFAPRPFA